MSRRATLGLSLVLLLAAGLLLWWTLSGPTTQPPSRQSVVGLRDTVSIGWTNQHTAVVDASNDADALRALGYVHGMTRPWTVTLWRRTALGRLSALFGTNLVPIDRHVRTLGFARHARRAYDHLSRSVQQSLKAYGQGLNAALQSERVRRRAPFLYFPLTPERWQPWHALAVERLLAWIGTALPTMQAASAVPQFLDADRRLRRWLHLHGWTRSLAWAARPRADTTRPILFARHVLGNTATPVIQELTLRRPGRPATLLATLPGTLLFPTGTSGRRSWTYLLSSPLRLERRPIDTTDVQTRHERIRPANGDERLVTVRQYDGGVLLRSPSTDTTAVLRWPGFRPSSDLSHWTRMAQLAAPKSPVSSDVQLFRGLGLTVDSTGTWTVHGEPPIVERGPNTILIGRSPWARHQADALRAHRAHGLLRPRRWSVSDSSTWA
ncbi:MAG: penicillin acylase family protein, partial [Salinibacter sp.]